MAEKRYCAEGSLVFDYDETSKISEFTRQTTSPPPQRVLEAEPELILGAEKTDFLDQLFETRNRRLTDLPRSIRNTLNEFWALDKFKQLTRHPKKEHLRCKLIRGHKRISRQIQAGVVPCKTLNRLDLYNPDATELWSQLQRVQQKCKATMESISRTEAGPLTDGRGKRPATANTQRSFNDEFCRHEYFWDEEVRESYHVYLEYLFACQDPAVLCTKFAIYCCQAGHHDDACVTRWLRMKQLMQIDLLEELGFVRVPQVASMDTDSPDEFINA